MEKIQEEKKIKWTLIAAVLSINLLSMTSGNAYAWTSPVFPKLQQENEENPLGVVITPFEESWVAALLSLGATIGPIFGGILINRIGRKKTMFIIAIPITAANILLIFAKTVELYYFARFMLGLGVGCVYSLVPMYIGEISENSNRGAFGCCMNILSNIATVLCYCIGPYISVQFLSFYCFLPSLLFFLVWRFLIPESPYYLVMIEQYDEAKKVLEKYHSGSSEKELEDIKKNVQGFSNTKFNLLEALKPKAVQKAMWIGMGLMCFQQFSGITAVICFMQPIFISAGTTLSSVTSVQIVSAVMLTMAVITSQLIDRVGRKILLVVAYTGHFLSLVALGTFFYLKDNGYDVSNLGLLPVLSMMLYFICFNMGTGPVAWSMLGELFALEIKPFATTVTGCFCLFAAFILTIFYPNFSAAVGVALSFWFFAFFCGVGVLFIIFLVPETKGRSFNEIQVLLSGERK